MENYVEYNFIITPLMPWQEILLAELSLYDFNTFEEVAEGLNAYIPERLDSNNLLSDLALLQNPEVKISYTKTVIPPINWNKEWENNFNPIVVDNQCYVRAIFHPHKSHYPYEIIIQPKMSFGTGHHQTTYLMLQFILESDMKDKVVMDMGCGTGILAILAQKKGAESTFGIDYDQWAIDNANENNGYNHTKSEFHLGEASKLIELNLFYDYFLANINKNILIRDIPTYSKFIKPNGYLILSGILESDFQEIISLCKEHSLLFIEKKQKEDWIAIQLKKSI